MPQPGAVYKISAEWPVDFHVDGDCLMFTVDAHTTAMVCLASKEEAKALHDLIEEIRRAAGRRVAQEIRIAADALERQL